MKCRFSFLIWSLSAVLVFAQQDSTPVMLPEVTIRSDRWHAFSGGSARQTFDSMSLAVNALRPLGELLRREAGLVLRTSGLSALSTLSLRGTGAGHSTVWWNGFNLQNTMSGVMDYHLLPVAMTDAAVLQYGSTGALSGSGVLGGGLFLYNRSRPERGWDAGITLGSGSWHTFDQFASLRLKTRRTAHSFRVFHHQTKGNFPFSDVSMPGTPLRRLENAASRLLSVLLDQHIEWNSRHRIQVSTWYQDSRRQIPPSMTESNAKAVQYDRSLRIALQQFSRLGRVEVANRVGWFSEYLRFDNILFPAADSRYDSWMAETEATFSEGRHQWRAGISAAILRAHVMAYSGVVGQERASLMASWKYHPFPRLETVLNARYEWPGNGKAQFTPSLGGHWKVGDRLRIHAQVSRNYRLPTFNDLYWQEAYAQGNPDLLPEQGWSEELGFSYQPHLGNAKWDMGLTMYSQQIGQWIHWLPQGNIWQPENLSSVWSRGLEGFVKCHFHVKNVPLQWSARYIRTHSTIIAVQKEVLQQGVGKQLPYVPFQQGTAGIRIPIRRWYAEYIHQWVGKRFIHTDHSDALAGYQTGSLVVAYHMKTGKTNLKCQLLSDNIWNTAYQSVAWRPMPGRSWHIQCQVAISGTARTE